MVDTLSPQVTIGLHDESKDTLSFYHEERRKRRNVCLSFPKQSMGLVYLLLLVPGEFATPWHVPHHSCVYATRARPGHACRREWLRKSQEIPREVK